MRRTLASPILATSSNSPAAIRGEVLSASISTASRADRDSLAAMLFLRFGVRRIGRLILLGLFLFSLGRGFLGFLIRFRFVALHAVEAIVRRAPHERSFP